MWGNFKKQLPFAVKNADKIIAIIIFFCTASGAWFLYSYANGHGVKFSELIQPNLLISYGAFSFFLIFFISMVFFAAFFFSPVIARSLYFHILIKERHGNRRIIKINYLFFFLWCGTVASISFFKCILLPFSLFIINSIQHVIIYGKDFSWKNTQKTLTLFAFSFLLLIISYAILLFLSLTLNFKIDSTFSLNGIVQSLFIFMTVFVLSIVGLADIHQRRRNDKDRMFFYMLFSLICVFYIATAFSSGISESITRQIGLGYKYRCYYYNDVFKYSIPEKLIKKASPGKIKVFVISDANNRIYLSRGDKYRAEYAFTARDLSEIACDE